MPPRSPTAEAERADARALDLHEGIDDPRGGRGCGRWPEGRYLVNEATGELVHGRCRATNLCAYCRTLYVIETAEMLMLDAMEHAPAVWAVLTAREHLTRADCRRHLRQVYVAARRRWPAIEWFVQVEFQRRGALHVNLLVKGVPADDAEQFRDLVCRVWCSRVDGLPVGQWVGKVYDAGGLAGYLTTTLVHGLKREQAPPHGWRGHRTSQTRGYLVRPAAQLRKEARRALAIKRLIWRGLDATSAELEVDLRADETWRLVGVPVGTPGIVAAPGNGLSDQERDELLLLAGERDYGGDPIERMAARVLDALRDDDRARERAGSPVSGIPPGVDRE